MLHNRVLQAVTMAVVTALITHGGSYLASTVGSEAPSNEVNQPLLESNIDFCVDGSDVFQLDVPGTYTAFAIGLSGSLVTKVRGSEGELLATSHPTKASTAAVDLLSGLRFGIPAPQVFEVESDVTIQVHHENSPYELMLVSVTNTLDFSRLNVRPPVERVVNQSGSCPISDSYETFKILADAVYSETGVRQIFAIDPPSGPSMTESFSGIADRYDVLLEASRSLVRGHLLFTSRFFPIR